MPNPSRAEALREADDLLARLLSFYSMIWNPILRRKIRRIRKQIAAVLEDRQ